ncbi:YqcC family protein [Thiohalomonas denitrificans]|uniref:Uncharacterized conserved protein YqcC, DUF446 family n=1 Tax=Thiohalomonas denitrificans TaxID=415747 RepID=A0A1G5PS34_9GAMM|nr:YqcC family protein [Thiohalomonas denitrificans]SCZ52136.1 Uncharacterized conserved protein YqcC, DUF446 family [Thiohalomonas denitrificans]
MNSETHQLADLLLAIEAEMHRIGLWEADPPSEEALSSLAPFCYDTLQFHQWLQWVFIPKTKAIVEVGEDWPSRSDIFPLAEHAFREITCDTGMLLLLIKQFDNFINRS